MSMLALKHFVRENGLVTYGSRYQTWRAWTGHLHNRTTLRPIYLNICSVVTINIMFLSLLVHTLYKSYRLSLLVYAQLVWWWNMNVLKYVGWNTQNEPIPLLNHCLQTAVLVLFSWVNDRSPVTRSPHVVLCWPYKDMLWSLFRRFLIAILTVSAVSVNNIHVRMHAYT